MRLVSSRLYWGRFCFLTVTRWEPSGPPGVLLPFNLTVFYSCSAYFKVNFGIKNVLHFNTEERTTQTNQGRFPQCTPHVTHTDSPGGCLVSLERRESRRAVPTFPWGSACHAGSRWPLNRAYAFHFPVPPWERRSSHWLSPCLGVTAGKLVWGPAHTVKDAGWDLGAPRPPMLWRHRPQPLELLQPECLTRTNTLHTAELAGQHFLLLAAGIFPMNVLGEALHEGMHCFVRGGLVRLSRKVFIWARLTDWFIRERQGRGFCLRTDVTPSLLLVELGLRESSGGTSIALHSPCSEHQVGYFITLCCFRHQTGWRLPFQRLGNFQLYNECPF